MSPFLALYGYHPPSITSPLKGNTKVDAVEDHIGDQQEVFKLFKNNLVMAQNRMKQQADQHHSEREIEVGDLVFMRFQPYKHMTLKKQNMDNKLAPKYYAPYKVLQRIGIVAYKLELPPYSHVHLVFHVSFLKKVTANKIPVQTILLEINEEGRIILEPETMLETQIKQLRNQTITKDCVKWKNLPVEEATWEDEIFL
jgi:hypothetical protein